MHKYTQTRVLSNPVQLIPLKQEGRERQSSWAQEELSLPFHPRDTQLTGQTLPLASPPARAPKSSTPTLGPAPPHTHTHTHEATRWGSSQPSPWTFIPALGPLIKLPSIHLRFGFSGPHRNPATCLLKSPPVLPTELEIQGPSALTPTRLTSTGVLVCIILATVARHPPQFPLSCLPRVTGHIPSHLDLISPSRSGSTSTPSVEHSVNAAQKSPLDS